MYIFILCWDSNNQNTTLRPRYCISVHLCRCPALFLVSLHCCFYLCLCLWGFSSRPQFDPQNSTDFLAVGGPPAFPWLSCLPDPHQRACLLLRQERDMTVWPTYMLTHRFIARLNEDAASSLYRVTLLRLRSAPAPLQDQWRQQATWGDIFCLLTATRRHQQTSWRIFDFK